MTHSDRILGDMTPVSPIAQRARPSDDVLMTIYNKPAGTLTAWDQAYLTRIEREAE